MGSAILGAGLVVYVVVSLKLLWDIDRYSR